MLYEIHILKNYPATNLNRDETGAPKTCYFGGSQRGRISSQCLKRSWRTSELFAALGSLGCRSRNLPELVAQELQTMGVGDEYLEHSKQLVINSMKSQKNQKEDDEKQKKSKGKKEFITGQAIFFAPDDVSVLAKEIKKQIDECSDAKAFKKATATQLVDLVKEADARAITLDIALFGRMVTSDVILNVEASMQVAHAVSTHPVNMESDYFTAVDDMIQMSDDSSRASMIGEVDYNSCCYYIYASLDVDKLKENLKDSPDALAKVEQLIPVLIRVMAMSNPSGKQNTFAGHVRPETVMVEYKKDKIPLSYANAYAEAVSRTSRKIVSDSIDKLVAEVNLMDDCYGLKPAHRGWFALRSENHPADCEVFKSFDALLTACVEWMKE